MNVTPGGGAGAAGLTAGDIIVSVNGTKTPTSAVLSEVPAQLQPGQKVTLSTVTSNAAKKTVTVTLGQLPG